MLPNISFRDMSFKIEAFLEHQFHEKNILRCAIWRLYPDQKNINDARESERLELLGDKILGFLLVDTLLKRYPEATDRSISLAISHMASNKNGAQIIKRQSFFYDAIASKMHHSVRFFSHLCETLIGALYCDGGLEAARRFILKQWKESLDHFNKITLDPKTSLQEWAQREHGMTPKYRILSCEGLDHEPIYSVEVTIEEIGTAQGKGSSIRQAEQKAANAFDWNITWKRDLSDENKPMKRGSPAS